MIPVFNTLNRLNKLNITGKLHPTPVMWHNYSDTTLAVTPLSSTSMDLAWTNPNISGVTLKNVVVEISTDGVTFATSATLGVVTSTQVTGLTAGTLYYFRLVFISSRGVRTGNGISIAVNQPWSITPDFTITIDSNTALTLNFDTEGLDKELTGIIVYHSVDGTIFTFVEMLGAVSSKQYTGLENNSIHYYKVRYWSGVSVSGFSGVVVGFTMEPDFYSLSRSGLSLVDSVSTNNATILPSTVNFNSTSTTQSLFLVYNVNFTDGEININFLQPTYGSAAGGLLSDGPSGQNFIQFRTANTIMIRISGTIKTFTFASISTTTLNSLRMVVTAVGTTKVRMYLNGVEANEGEQDMAALKTFIFRRVGYYHNMLLPYVKVTNNGNNTLEMWPMGLTGSVEYNMGDTNNYGSWVATPVVSYLSTGGTQYLDNGFKIYEKPVTSVSNADKYVPYTISDTYMSNALEYVLKETRAGNSTLHNQTPSLIEFVGNIWDRSNTEIWGNDARTGHYDVSNPKRWHISELYQSNINALLNASYKNSIFIKFNENTVDHGRDLSEIFTFASPLSEEAANNANKYIGLLPLVTNLSASFDIPTISGYLSWDELSGYDYEIWRSVYGRTATLITTVTAGTTTFFDTTCKQCAYIKYWVKPIKNGVYGATTNATIFLSPWCFKTNQSTLQTVTFSAFTLSAGSWKVTVNWGDGNIIDYTSTLNPTTHNYTSTGLYNISISGDLNRIALLEVKEQMWVYGDITNWVFPKDTVSFHMYKTGLTGDVTDHHNWFWTAMKVYDAQYLQITGDLTNWRFKTDSPNMKDIHFEGSLVTGDITDWTFPETVETLSSKLTLFDTLLTGDLSDWVLPDGMNWLRLIRSNFTIDMSKFHIASQCSLFEINNDTDHTNVITGDITGLNIFPTIEGNYSLGMELAYGELSGDASSCIIPDGLTMGAKFYFRDNNLTKMPRGAFDMVIFFSFTNNNCDSTEIDAFLAYVDTYFTGATVPKVNAVYSIDGTGMGIPSAAGLASITSILGKYTAEGKTCTISVNS